MAHKTVCVSHCSVRPYNGDWPPENAVECVAWFADKLAGIPEQYRDSARIEINLDNSDYEPVCVIEITYWRPETDDEYRDRLEIENRRVETAKARELKTLARLKAKYEQSDTD